MYKCKCCGHETLPVPPEDAVGFICPICWWENNVFTADDDESSDENQMGVHRRMTSFPIVPLPSKSSAEVIGPKNL